MLKGVKELYNIYLTHSAQNCLLFFLEKSTCFTRWTIPLTAYQVHGKQQQQQQKTTTTKTCIYMYSNCDRKEERNFDEISLRSKKPAAVTKNFRKKKIKEESALSTSTAALVALTFTRKWESRDKGNIGEGLRLRFWQGNTKLGNCSSAWARVQSAPFV